MGKAKSQMQEKYIKKDYESTCNSSDTFSTVYESMMLSPAWFALSAKQQMLYVVCKSQLYAEKKKPENDLKLFTMNMLKWIDKYRLYTRANSAGFYRDMTALIEKGFISCHYRGKSGHVKSVYEFSSKWRLFGTANFKILHTEMNDVLLERLKAKE